MEKQVSLSMYRYYNRSGVTTTVPGPDGKPVTVRNGEYVTGEWFARFASFKGPTVKKPLVAELPPGLVVSEEGKEVGSVSELGVGIESVELKVKGEEEVKVEKEERVEAKEEGEVKAKEEGEVKAKEEVVVSDEVGKVELGGVDVEYVRGLLKEEGIEGKDLSLEDKGNYVKVILDGEDFYYCKVCKILLKSARGLVWHMKRRHGIDVSF